MIKRIALDVQHLGKPNKPHDRGAEFEVFTEVDLVLTYVCKTLERLTNAGFETFMITSGTYSERHAWVNQNNIDLYLACHLNAGGGSYSLVEHYYDASENTKNLAKIMARNFKINLGTSDAKVWEIAKDERGAICLKNTKPYALLLEPLFIDNPTHLYKAWQQYQRIATAILLSIHQFNR